MFGGTFSILHWIVVLAVVLLLFGAEAKFQLSWVILAKACVTLKQV